MEDSSFVVVEPELDQATVLSSLNEFFPSLTTGDWSLWSVDRQLEVSQQRQRRPDGRLFVDELFSLVEMDGKSQLGIGWVPQPELASWHLSLRRRPT